jgi:opacity protein-like surface antigen
MQPVVAKNDGLVWRDVMRMSKIPLCLAAALVLTACSKVKDTVVPTDMSTWDKELAPIVQKLEEEDKKLFVGYVMRMKMGEAFGAKGGGIPFGTTVGQAIEQQKTWQAEFERKQAAEKAERERKAAEEAALKRKLEEERAAAIKKINEAVTVTLLAKRELPRDFNLRRISDYQEFEIGVQNISKKDVVGVAGTMEFIDVFDKSVGGVNFKVSQTIKPGATYRWVGGRDYNQFIDHHRALWNLEDGKYKTRFVPSAVVYADGEKLELPE